RRPGGHRPPHEPVPGPDGEGRSHDDDEVGGVHERVRLGDARGRDVLAEVDDVRLEHAAAAGAVGDAERGGVGEQRVGVGGDLDRAAGGRVLGEPGVESLQVLVQGPATASGAAFQADHHRVRAVEVDDPGAAGLEMEEVD